MALPAVEQEAIEWSRRGLQSTSETGRESSLTPSLTAMPEGDTDTRSIAPSPKATAAVAGEGEGPKETLVTEEGRPERAGRRSHISGVRETHQVLFFCAA